MALQRIKFDRPVALIGAGSVSPKILQVFQDASMPFVAADGGSNHLFCQRITPQFVIGDFDSSEPKPAPSATQWIKVEDQDTTDFEKSILRISAPLILAHGFTGMRLDHTLSAINVMARHYQAQPLYLIGEEDFSFVAKGDLAITSLPQGCRISIFPLEKITFKVTSGFEYGFADAPLAPSDFTSISNRAVSCDIFLGTDGQYRDGKYLVTLELAALPALTQSAGLNINFS